LPLSFAEIEPFLEQVRTVSSFLVSPPFLDIGRLEGRIVVHHRFHATEVLGSLRGLDTGKALHVLEHLTVTSHLVELQLS